MKIENSTDECNMQQSEARQYLAIVFSQLYRSAPCPIVPLAQQAGVGKSTIYKLINGHIPSLASLCRLFALPELRSALQLKDLETVMNMLIRESHTELTYPKLQIRPVPDVPLEAPFHDLPHFMRHIRIDVLHWSTRKIDIEAEGCTRKQLADIEKGKPALIPATVYHLFEAYHRSLPQPLKERYLIAWAVLLCRKMFKHHHGYSFTVVEWKKGNY